MIGWLRIEEASHDHSRLGRASGKLKLGKENVLQDLKHS